MVRSGNILIQATDLDQAANILGLTAFMGKAVTASPVTRLNPVEGTIHTPPLAYLTEEELLEELRDQAVVEVHRLRSRNGRPNPRLKLRFKLLELPPVLTAGYELFPVSEWVQAPLLCRRCGSYGHPASKCRNPEICLRWCGDGTTKSETETH